MTDNNNGQVLENSRQIIEKYTVIENKNASITTDLTGQNFQHQQFTDFSIRKKTIQDCDFSYGLFQRVYFRNVNFINCDFTGAKFFDSNLRYSEFEHCKFSYATFKFTSIQSDQVLNNLPEWPNVKIHLLQNHKANANSLGDTKAVRKYLLQEIEANKDHLHRAIKRNEGYYSKKYKGTWIQAKVRWQLFLMNVDSFLWGHGESPFKIVRNVLYSLLIITLLQTLLSKGIFSTSAQQFFSQIWILLKADIKAFIGINTDKIDSISKGILILVRYLTLGLFIRILFNKYSWR